MSLTTDPATAEAQRPAAGRRRPFALILIAASLPMFMAALDNLVMTFALSTIQVELTASIEQLQWFCSLFSNACTLPNQ